jgi:CRISPR-associated protein Csb2
MFGEDAPAILSGHRSPDQPADTPHLAYVPLPFVGHDRADGSLLGVALVLPRLAGAAERRAVHRALHTWESQDPGSRDGDAALPVHLGRGGTLTLARSARFTASTLRPRSWCQEAERWVTATPIALDNHPGDLRSSDSRKAAAAYAAAAEVIARSCTRIGLPAPRSVTVLPAAPLAGGEKTRHFPAFLAGDPGVRRVLTHAEIVFDTPVRGPLLIGAGRYFGLGLMRPLRGDTLAARTDHG